MTTDVVPSLLSQLNANHCISTRWIAKAAEKPPYKVHEDVRRILGIIHVVEDVRDSRGYTREMWLELHDALYMMSQYNSERAERAKDLVREAIRYFIHDRPRLEAENEWLRSDRETLIANQKRVPVTPPRKRPRRIYVPYLVATMYGLRFELRKRGKRECEPWQWELGLVPWAVHAIAALQSKIDQAIAMGESSIMARFLPSEFSDGNGSLRHLFEDLVRDMCERPERYTEGKGEVLSA